MALVKLISRYEWVMMSFHKLIPAGTCEKFASDLGLGIFISRASYYVSKLRARSQVLMAIIALIFKLMPLIHTIINFFYPS